MWRARAEWGGVGEWASLRRPMILARDRVAATRAVAYFLMVCGAVVGSCGCMLTIVVTKLRARADTLVAMLELQALSDPLTGLPNRRAFDRDLAAALDAARRTGAERCLLIIDVDRFKTINDTWGHATGDAVLVQVAAALREATAASGMRAAAARLGGDEFAVVVHGDVSGAQRIAAVVRAAVGRMSDLPEGLPTLSIGLASTSSGAVEPEALLAAADRALYDAKVRGRDRVSVVEAVPRRRPRTVPQR
ncbi:GGDEF domain-containing protein [Dactylosporangium sp. NPDC050688]|uniref:GGDEF domain-containing protein n=1 Tax=Dactylosporangium sp. NPDC050688 TaxID=3157217 RepID=UPI0033FA556B